MRKIQSQREAFALDIEASVLDDYRTERHRQEVELENQTGGYAADIKDHFDRGGKPLINYKDWLKSRKVGPGQEQAAAQGVDPSFTYVPEEGSDYTPPW